MYSLSLFLSTFKPTERMSPCSSWKLLYDRRLLAGAQALDIPLYEPL
jgi:hypothetical protein